MLNHAVGQGLLEVGHGGGNLIRQKKLPQARQPLEVHQSSVGDLGADEPERLQV